MEAGSTMIRNVGGFPGGPVLKNPPANVGDTSLIPGPGPHSVGQLSPRSTTREATTMKNSSIATGVVPALRSYRKPAHSNKYPVEPKINTENSEMWLPEN